MGSVMILGSRSYLANLGALAQLNYMPYHEPPTSGREELRLELKKTNASQLPIIKQRTKLVPREYLDEADLIDN